MGHRRAPRRRGARCGWHRIDDHGARSSGRDDRRTADGTHLLAEHRPAGQRARLPAHAPGKNGKARFLVLRSAPARALASGRDGPGAVLPRVCRQYADHRREREQGVAQGPCVTERSCRAGRGPSSRDVGPYVGAWADGQARPLRSEPRPTLQWMPTRQRDGRDGTTRVGHNSDCSSCLRGQSYRPALWHPSGHSPSESRRRQCASHPMRRLFRTRPRAGVLWCAGPVHETADAREPAAVRVPREAKPEVIPTQDRKIATPAC